MSKIYYKQVNLKEKIDINYFKNKEIIKHLNNLKGTHKVLSFNAYKLLKEIILNEYKLNIDELEMHFNEYNKPFFKEFYFNISHCNDIIAIGISNKEIGIDIEALNKKMSNALKKRLNIYNDIELIKEFSKLESYYKKLGIGINVSLLTNKVNITSQVILNLNIDYVLSIAISDEKYEIINI